MSSSSDITIACGSDAQVGPAGLVPQRHLCQLQMHFCRSHSEALVELQTMGLTLPTLPYCMRSLGLYCPRRNGHGGRSDL